MPRRASSPRARPAAPAQTAPPPRATQTARRHRAPQAPRARADAADAARAGVACAARQGRWAGVRRLRAKPGRSRARCAAAARRLCRSGMRLAAMSGASSALRPGRAAARRSHRRGLARRTRARSLSHLARAPRARARRPGLAAPECGRRAVTTLLPETISHLKGPAVPGAGPPDLATPPLRRARSRAVPLHTQGAAANAQRPSPARRDAPERRGRRLDQLAPSPVARSPAPHAFTG